MKSQLRGAFSLLKQEKQRTPKYYLTFGVRLLFQNIETRQTESEKVRLRILAPKTKKNSQIPENREKNYHKKSHRAPCCFWPKFANLGL